MGLYTQRFSEGHYPLVEENADSFAANTYDSAYASLQDYHRAVLVINVGDMGQGATLDVQIRQATSAAGAGVKTIADKAGTGTKAITQLTQAGGDGNQLLCIELQTEELDVDNRFSFVGVRAVVAGASIEYSWILYGIITRFKPVPTTNWDEVID